MAISQFLSPDPDSKDSYHYTELPKLPFPFPTAPHRSKLPSHVQKKPSIQTPYHRFKKREGGRTENRHPSCNSPGRSFPIDEHRYPDRFLNRVSPRRSPFESLPSFGVCRDAGSSSSSFSLFRRGNRSKKKKKEKGEGRIYMLFLPNIEMSPRTESSKGWLSPPPFFFDRITPPMFHEALYRDGGADWRRSDEVSGSVITFCHRDERGREKKRR